jgi:hypothetical protein
VPTHTLVLPHQPAYVLATDTTAYAKRFDMIACVHFDGLFTPLIVSPADRTAAKVKGLTADILVQYIRDTLGPEVAALPQRSYVLMLDRASIHSAARITQAFQECGVELERLVYLPTQAAKRASPLDNTVFSGFKQQVRERCPITLENAAQSMIDSWSSIQPDFIRAQYHNCKLMRYDDVYEDCPCPEEHRHRSGQ